MALIPTLTIKDTTTFSDTIDFSVTDTLTVASPAQAVSLVTVTTTGGNHIILPNVDAKRYLYVKHLGVATLGGSAVTTTLAVETADNTAVITLAAGEWMFAPIHDGDATLIQLQASGSTIVAEYAYWTAG